MRHPLLHISGVLLISLGVTASAQAGDGAFLGTGLGAAFGGLFGSQLGRGAGNIAATGTGVIIGGVIGNRIGQSIDTENSTHLVEGRGYIPYSQPVSIVYGAYAPNYVAPPAPPPIYIDESVGTYCRPYSQEVHLAGRVQETYGTACLQPDGMWRIVP